MARTLNDIRQQMATNGAAVQFRMVDRFLNGSESKILPKLYMMEEKTFSYEYVVTDSFGTVTSRSLNTNYATEGDSSHREKEPMAIFGGEVKTDYIMIDVKGESARLDALDKKMTAAGKYFDKLFLHGDPRNPIGGDKGRGNELRGLRARANAANTIYAGANGNPLALTMLDEALDAVVGDNNKKFLIMNRVERRELSSLLRTQTNVNFTMDDKRQVKTYDDAEIIVLDEDEAYNQILPFTETRGASGVTTSIYCGRFGSATDEEFIQGIIGNKFMQLRPASPQGTYVLEVAETLIGLGTFHPRSFIRIAGLTKAA